MSDAGIWCLIPVKRLKDAKRRLSAALSEGQREMLVRIMATDVIRAALATPRLSGVAVVTADEEIAALARREGATVLAEEMESGLNAALAGAMATASRLGATGVLILPGDVPLVTPADIEAMLEGHNGNPAVTIARADSDGGSNALACSPPDLLPFSFGPDSFARHCALARKAGIEPMLPLLPRLALDIDRPADLGAMLSRNSQTLTHGYLSGLNLKETAASAAGMTTHEA